ncbi:hypothetical protein GCM10007320_61490 [Pseudorhodoferax aquiterrae]|uniref:Uncharacterized protein n=1 Tax=Pseudorhodoferax aquiterrae TaxID=747304 RepID=A0ABQ3GDL7_9BURK|nr:hypothetical protein [Pseudorhodoferax aquiterrae]GHD02332.1 hypothetical protein GCM10007320_61490 [Pseudorhodoferax aquiterrae]
MAEFSSIFQAFNASVAARQNAEAVLAKETAGLAGVAKADTIARVREARRREQYCLKAMLYESEALDAEALRARRSVPDGERLLDAQS